MKKLTTSEFIRKSKEIHGDIYDYSKVDYVNSKNKVTITCSVHGDFEQTSVGHLGGHGCPKCGLLISASRRTCTTYKFIEDSRAIHSDRYDYSKVNYVNSQTKVIIVCPIHGDFEPTPNNHLRGSGCPTCGNNVKKTLEKFIEDSRAIHGDKYEYYKCNYVSCMAKITITCPIHGDFEQRPNSHLHGQGCPGCGGVAKSTGEEFIKKSVEIYGDKYEYSKVNYVNNKTKVTITCPIHGDFEPTPNNHLRGSGCPTCNNGWSISAIKKFLKELINIIPSMTQAEWYHILRSSGILNIDNSAKGFGFSKILLRKDKLDFNELGKFANDDEPSVYDDFIETGDTSLIDNEEDEEKDIEDLIDNAENEEVEDFSDLTAKDIFNKLEKISDQGYLDGDVAEAIIGENIWQLIQVVCEDEEQVKEIRNNRRNNLPQEVRTRFLALYDGARGYKLPKNYNFRIDEKLINPNLMQRMTIALSKNRECLFNLSGTGSGKTLSAVLSSINIESELSVIIAPNDVMAGWVRTIEGADPSSNIFINNFNPKLIKGERNYVVFNVEKFQQSNTEEQIRKLVKNNIDFIVFDEIHFLKNRKSEMRSRRNENIHKFISSAKSNPNLKILGMTATPVVNELSEGVSLLELMTGKEYGEIGNSATIENCMALRGQFVSMGVRWMPKYEQKLNIITIPVDCSDKIDEVKGARRNPLLMEQIFVEDKMNSIIPLLKRGSVIYTQYKECVVESIIKKVKAKGFTCEPYTGDQNYSLRMEILNEFIDGKVDVLVATSPFATGLDGVQRVCNELFLISLPWTAALYEHLIGRFMRPGQNENHVNVTIPLSYMNVNTPSGNSKEWSWCKYRYSIIRSKRSLSNVAVDGVIPDMHHVSESKALASALDWLKRIEDGDINDFKRKAISVSLSDASLKKKRKKHGNFTDINRKICAKKSENIHEEWSRDPSEYEVYHNEYLRFRKKWNFDHMEEIVKPFVKSLPSDYTVGDFGSGPLVEIANSTNKKVLSFDHVETKGVVSCDIATMPSEYYNSLNVAVFSLSLMGRNLTDYLMEAHKCLKDNGQLFVVELSSRVGSRRDLERGIGNLGFKEVKTELVDKFIVIHAKKSKSKTKKNVTIKLSRIKI